MFGVQRRRSPPGGTARTPGDSGLANRLSSLPKDLCPPRLPFMPPPLRPVITVAAGRPPVTTTCDSASERNVLLEKRFRCRMTERVKPSVSGCPVRRRRQLPCSTSGEDHAKQRKGRCQRSLGIAAQEQRRVLNRRKDTGCRSVPTKRATESFQISLHRCLWQNQPGTSVDGCAEQKEWNVGTQHKSHGARVKNLYMNRLLYSTIGTRQYS